MERVILGIILLVGSAAGQTIVQGSGRTAMTLEAPAQSGSIFLRDSVGAWSTPETMAQSTPVQTPNRNLQLDKYGNINTPGEFTAVRVPDEPQSSGKCLVLDSSGTRWMPTPVDCPGVKPSTPLACPPAGCTAIISSGTGTVSTVAPLQSGSSTPSNEVVMKPLEYGKKYSGKAVEVQIMPNNADGILLAITPKVSADWAIIEVLYRQTATIEGRDMRLFRTKTQAVHMGDFGPGVASLSDVIPLKLEDVEKINVRLVAESHVVEFWSDTSEVKAERKEHK